MGFGRLYSLSLSALRVRTSFDPLQGAKDELALHLNRFRTGSKQSQHGTDPGHLV